MFTSVVLANELAVAKITGKYQAGMLLRYSTATHCAFLGTAGRCFSTISGSPPMLLSVSNINSTECPKSSSFHASTSHFGNIFLMSKRTTVFPSNANYRLQPVSFKSPKEWWDKRQEKKQEKEFEERIEYMSSKEKWTMSDMVNEIDEKLNKWVVKIPGMGRMKDVKLMKELSKKMKAVTSTLGEDADLERMENMTRVEKLKIALAGEMTLEEVNILIKKYESMYVMHKVLRNRRMQNKPVPGDMESLQAIMQVEGPKAMTEKMKKRVMEKSKTQMRRGLRQR